jgi:hypothetical protein
MLPAALAVVAVVFASGASAALAEKPIVPAEFGRSGTTMWSPTLEWTLKNPSHDGNPFDLVAKVTFRHESGKEARTTEMFYAADGTWKFRFTGTRTGEWTFTTRADGAGGTTRDLELDDRKGTITVKPNSRPQARGFLTTSGQKYARQVGNQGGLRGTLFNVYMNEKDFHARFDGVDWSDPARIDAYLADARRCGFYIVFLHVNNSWFKYGTNGWDEHRSTNPDPKTFEVLEHFISRTHAKGMHTQIWAWGDEARKWTPIGVGGINGGPDRRLQRYIAARLGPLPGWTMGYGFDLHEWTSEDDMRQWASYLHEHFGWQHLLWARGRSNDELDVKSYADYGVRSYEQIVKDLASDPDRPQLYEERHTRNRNARLNAEGTRRFLWDLAMAGGFGCWWGFYNKGGSQGPPYPNADQLHTHATFWNERSTLDLQRDNGITNGLGLRNGDFSRVVLYKEDTERVTMDLSRARGPLPAIAVDAKKAYREVDIGPLTPGKQTWQAPYKSDWAIAVGTFPMADEDTD